IFVSSISMGSHRTKEDDVAKISTSIYITNFSETCSAKDLFNTCKQYGHVVDVFIPSKRSKAGKRFQRPPMNVKIHVMKSTNGGKNYNTSANVSANIYKNDQRPTGVGKTYMHAVKGISQHGSRENEVLALVLDNDCLLSKDLSKCLLGRVKEFASLANLKMTLNNEGFMDIKIQYMREMWVMLEFGTEKSMKLFRDNVSVGSWFSQINQAFMDFVTKGRIAWVELEGIPFKVWSGNTFKRIAAKWGVLLDIDDQEETCFHSKRLCIHTKSYRSISEEFKIIFRGLKCMNLAAMKKVMGREFQKPCSMRMGLMKKQSEEENMDNHDDMSEDPFRIYFLLKKKDKVVSNKDSEFSMNYPPGFTPNEGSDGASMHVKEGRGGNSENENEGNVDVDNAVPSGNHSGLALKAKKMGSRSFVSFFKKSSDSVGFSKIVEDAWKESPSDESNAMISMMGKLKFLKTKIREWNKTNMLCRKNVKAQCKADLEAVEVIIDSGNGNEEIAIKRTELVKNLQHIDKLNSLEIAQKAKVKWAIEGDENSSFFHGMLNKKRNTLSIRGIMVDGIWIDDPNLVKREFLMHFSSRFSKPDNRRALIQMRFPKRLSLEQQVELESEVSNEEIKRAVWDCGSDKAPGASLATTSTTST
ncbi:RNA-directed DNA polymerase, eukaryota, partial [Tanacetum coccineum]